MERDTDDDAILLHALADGELDVATTLALERRIAAEPAFAAAYDEILAVRGAVGRLERPAVSEDFRARIAALTAVDAPSVVPLRRRRPSWSPDWRAMAAAIILSAGVASGLTFSIVAPREDVATEEAVIDGHRRSLLAASPIDIASSDRHTVRPWLDAKLGIAPPTPDLAADGFPLVGGRVDVVAGRAVPTLVYRHGPHLITVVAIPLGATDATERGPTVRTAAGYNLVRWSGDGFRYWAMSDLDASALEAFAAKLRGK